MKGLFYWISMQCSGATNIRYSFRLLVAEEMLTDHPTPFPPRSFLFDPLTQRLGAFSICLCHPRKLNINTGRREYGRRVESVSSPPTTTRKTRSRFILHLFVAHLIYGTRSGA
ncbi:hypothetical protein GWI33_003956 [Rhynchophorus ferrugineus]|uniref:Uncharacterized protein n=1 Tax=Rhynchophorus ferrugineus TaxID=354439 RepID=A0A834HKC2_RHYFE|nr:hypothetical protein GWI33_003956 [Rhynchophorus ferrugineus]